MPLRILRDWTDSEPVNSVSWQAEVLFVRLIMKADDFGRFSANPKLLRSLLFPLRDGFRESDISSWLKEIETAGLVATYQIDEKPLLEIVKFDQRLRQKKSKWPERDSNMPSIDGLNGNRNTNRNTNRNGNTPTQTSCFDPISNEPKLSDIIQEAEKLCLVFAEDEAQKFIDYYSAFGWMPKGSRILNWTKLLKKWHETGKEMKAKGRTDEPKPFNFGGKGA